MSALAAKWLAVAAGGAIGAALRYGLADLAHGWLGRDFPWGTLTVNVLGSLAIGYLLVLLPDSRGEAHWLHLLLLTGVLGGFTTFSAFSLETLQLLHGGQAGRAFLNIGGTVTLCLAAVWAGHAAGRLVHATA